jgi:uncharacterized OsmC-like protein
VASRDSGYGSRTNGGEFLCLALATCYCNDIYREADKRGISVERVEVEVNGDFGGPGDGASNVIFRAKVTADAPEAEIDDLMRYTDTVAEIQNTLRAMTPVTLTSIEAVSKTR